MVKDMFFMQRTWNIHFFHVRLHRNSYFLMTCQ
jgi:hypothetical protein